MRKNINPFYYGGIAKDEYFCNRINEIKDIKNSINSGLNLLIYAPRRFGKTSLVFKTLKELNCKYIYIDIMSIADENEFINEYFNAISQSLQTTTDKVINFFKSVLNLKPNINISVDSVGNPTYSLEFLPHSSKTVFKEVLNLPYQYALKTDEKIVVVFDEFQEVNKLKLEGKLRSIIQQHSHHLSYIFLGSKKSIMRNIFFNSNSAFYSSVKHITIKPIENDVWIEYISNGFEKHNKIISKEDILEILSITKGFPYYTQQIASELFLISENKITKQNLQEAIKMILERSKDLFLTQLELLTPNQKKALNLILLTGGKNIYSKEIRHLTTLNNSTLKKSIESLMQKDIIDKSDKYYLVDPMFEYFLKNKKNNGVK